MRSPSEVDRLVAENRGMAHRAAYRAKLSSGTRLDLDELAADEPHAVAAVMALRHARLATSGEA